MTFIVTFLGAYLSSEVALYCDFIDDDVDVVTDAATAVVVAASGVEFGIADFGDILSPRAVTLKGVDLLAARTAARS